MKQEFISLNEEPRRLTYEMASWTLLTMSKASANHSDPTNPFAHLHATLARVKSSCLLSTRSLQACVKRRIMKLTLVICLLFILGACFFESVSSTGREKRIFGFRKAFNKIKKITKKVVNKVDDIVDKGVDGIKDAAKYTGKITKKVIDKTDDVIDTSVDGIKDAAKYTGKITKKVIDKTDDIIDTSVDGVVKAAKYTGKISKKIGKGTIKFTKKAFKATYNAAKKGFNAIKELAKKVDFDAALLILVDLIDSDITNKACEVVCVSSAVYIIGPGVLFYANLACPFLCEAAMAYFEDLAESYVVKHVLND
ncbi:hypothetical protein RRG08_000437 [Elysia crispata]|uniref:Uncharacterized protein n=1 Tax=Elysia crispata TaxID=231223 RepID=A0AAE0YCJ2_9GAST|nr:hypothetical protein RRG08_000437 [Elysia crispata]